MREAGFTPASALDEAPRGAELPAANGHATARSLASLYGVLAMGGASDGVRVLSRESIARCHAERSFGMDEALGVSTRFGLGVVPFLLLPTLALVPVLRPRAR